MSTQESAYTDSTLSDFSSILLNVGDEVKDVDDDIINLSSSAGSTAENRNLSSVLSQIQDDGPAYDGSKKRGNLFNLKKNNDKKSHSAPDEMCEKKVNKGGATVEKVAPVQSRKLPMADTINISNRKKLLLIISIAVVVVLTLFNIELRTRYLEQAINDYKIDIHDSITTQGENFQIEITKINEILDTLKQDLMLVKTDYSDLDGRYHDAAENSISTKTDNVVLNNDVSFLGSEMLALKEDIESIKTQLNKKNKTKKPEITPVVNNGLIIDLVALTNVNKAEELVKKISDAGFTPSIKKAPFKNKSIYKISVSGFIDMKQAKVFMRNAGKQYGIHNSKIRKS